MKARHGQRGVALFTAIFLIVVIAVVAAVVALTTTTQQLSSARALDAERAYFAAAGRLDLAIATAIGGSCPADQQDTLAGFDTRVQCTAAGPVSEGGDSYTVYSIEVSAWRGDRGAGTLVRRTVRAQVTDAD